MSVNDFFIRCSLNMSPQPQPAIIKVAPAKDDISNLDAISNETLDNPYRRSREFDAYEVSITRHDEDHTDDRCEDLESLLPAN